MRVISVIPGELPVSQMDVHVVRVDELMGDWDTMGGGVWLKEAQICLSPFVRRESPDQFPYPLG